MSGKNYFMIERRARMQKIVEMIKKHENLEERKLKGLFILQTGARSRTVEEYLKELEEAGVIERNEGFLKAVL